MLQRLAGTPTRFDVAQHPFSEVDHKRSIVRFLQQLVRGENIIQPALDAIELERLGL